MRTQKLLDVRYLVLASIVSAVGYSLLPSVSPLDAAIPTMVVLRCLVAGCSSGLLFFGPRPRWAPAASTAAGIALGTTAIALVTPVGLHLAATIIGLVLGCAVALLLSWMQSSNLRVAGDVIAVSVVVGVMLWCAGFLPGGMRSNAIYQQRQVALAVPPQPGQYHFDGAVFRRTYYLMKGGQGYYAAFRQSVMEDARYKPWSLSSPFNYREPFVFYLWRVLPGDSGVALFDWFLVYAALALVCSYVLASALVARGIALLAPVALLAWFFYFFWTPGYFSLTEVWAAGFGVAATMCLVREWRVPSLVLLTAAVAAREFMVLLIPAYLLAWWLSRDRKGNWWFPVAAVVGPALVLGAHLLAVPPTSGSSGAVDRWLNGGIDRLLTALRYSFDFMPAGMWVSLAIAIAAVASAAIARPKWKMAALLAATILPMLFLLLFSGGVEGSYWGGFYTPLAISIAPGILGRLAPAEGGAMRAGPAVEIAADLAADTEPG